MNDAERDEILYRLDERTALMQDKFSDMDEGVSDQDRLIRRNYRLARDNRKILNVLTFGIGSFVTAFIGKLAGIIRI